MSSRLHQSANGGESFKISMLAGKKRIDFEERNDVFDEIAETAHFVLHGSIASVRSNAAAPKMLLREQKHFTAISVLSDGEAWSQFPADQQLAVRRE